MALGTKVAGALAASALVLTAVSPAAARDWGRPRGDYGRHDNGVSAGTVFGLLFGAATIAIIASAASDKKKKDEAARHYDDEPEVERSYNPGYDGKGSDGRGYDGRRPDERSYDDGKASYSSEDQAVDACAMAARDEASRAGGYADVRDITGVNRTGASSGSGSGSGWDVTGTITQRSSYRNGNGDLRSFRCLYDNGRVSGVSFSPAA